MYKFLCDHVFLILLMGLKFQAIWELLKHFKSHLFFYLCTYLCRRGTHMPQDTQGGQSWLCPSTMWVSGHQAWWEVFLSTKPSHLLMVGFMENCKCLSRLWPFWTLEESKRTRLISDRRMMLKRGWAIGEKWPPLRKTRSSSYTRWQGSIFQFQLRVVGRWSLWER